MATQTEIASPFSDLRIELDPGIVGTSDACGWLVTTGQRQRFDGWLELLAVLRLTVRDGGV